MKKFILFILNTALSFSLYAQTSASFAVLAGTGIANTGLTIINGNVGLHPDTSVTGFPPGVINGTLHVNDSAAIQAKNDLQAAYAYIVGLTPTAIIPDQLGGQILGPGIYASQSGAFAITGTLTLDARGDPNAIFIFQSSNTLNTADLSQIVLINGANPCNIFFQVGSTATLGEGSVFQGNILAQTSITANKDASVTGRLTVIDGAVTLDNNNVTVPTQCTMMTVLPVTFKSIRATRNRQNVTVSWETATETNNKGFNVQRNGGGGWEKVAFVNSKADGGNSNGVLSYTFNDVNTSRGVTQYRIQQVDIDGRSAFSDIRAVRGEGLETRLLVYPNPSNTGNLNVVFEDQNAVRDVLVRDISGRLVKQYKEVSNNILVIDNLVNGVYSIQVTDRTTSKSVFEKIVVRRN